MAVMHAVAAAVLLVTPSTCEKEGYEAFRYCLLSNYPLYSISGTTREMTLGQKCQ